MLASIRAYIEDDHTLWDAHVYQIASALRNAVHESTKFSPHYLVFGCHKINHGSDYELLDLLGGDYEIGVSLISNNLSIAQQLVLYYLKQAYAKHSKSYNLRIKYRTFTLGQKILIRNFSQSDAVSKYSAKLAPKYIKGFIGKKFGTVAYEILDDKNKSLGIYHIKDILNYSY